jgi:hypothetical protein
MELETIPVRYGLLALGLFLEWLTLLSHDTTISLKWPSKNQDTVSCDREKFF